VALNKKNQTLAYNHVVSVYQINCMLKTCRPWQNSSSADR